MSSEVGSAVNAESLEILSASLSKRQTNAEGMTALSLIQGAVQSAAQVQAEGAAIAQSSSGSLGAFVNTYA
ncbi:MAG: hypothetical protein J6M93_04485 [Succinivibrio sp.]|nr:hypothetical protein [Succinivibrio sp.]